MQAYRPNSISINVIWDGGTRAVVQLGVFLPSGGSHGHTYSVLCCVYYAGRCESGTIDQLLTYKKTRMRFTRL